MKKLIIPGLIMGIVLSSTSVFAESENEREQERQGGVRALLVSRNENENENEHSRSLSIQNYFSPGYVTVKDDVRIPTVADAGSIYSAVEQPQMLWLTSLARIKSRAAQLIRERINALTANRTVINANKSLTVEQKTALTNILNNNIAGLTTLGGAIASSTDATSSKQLLSSIYTNFRIFGIVIPQVRLEKRVFDLQNHSVKLSDTFLKVQAKIDAYKGKGKDVTAWQKSLDDAKILVATDMNALVTILAKVGALTPADYGTSSKMVIDTANKDLKNIAKDFNTIAKNLNKTKILKNKTSTSTPVIPGTGTTTTPVATTTTTTPTSTPSLTTYTTAQVATHATPADCWIVVSGKVYSVGGYISMHPGGSFAISSRCGQDATTAFNTRGGSGTHSANARSILGGFLVGTL